MKKISLDEDLLKEETLEQDIEKAEKVLDDPNVIEDQRQIEAALDRAYVVNKRKQKYNNRDYLNILFTGSAGVGKTARILAWGKEKGVNIVKVLASTMDDTDLGGAPAPNLKDNSMIRLAPTEMDELANVQDSVLFLDEFNRASKSVRGTLLTLIQDHTIRDDRVPGKARFLPNFLFTVAAINPFDPNYNVDELDDAEMGRFEEINVVMDKGNALNYFKKEYGRLLDEADKANDVEFKNELVGQLGIINALMSSREFRFDDQKDIDDSHEHGNGKILTVRTLTNCLNSSDGTKKSFLNVWNRHCNSLKKPVVERILSNYKDVNDKANDALKGKSDSQIFADKHKSNSELLSDYLDSVK